MGIYDRDYYRERPGRGRAGGGRLPGFGSVRMWSVNTWLIVICVAVFVIDGFLPPIAVQMQRRMLDQIDARDIDDSALIEGPLQQEMLRGVPTGGVRELFIQTPGGRLKVGEDYYQYMPPLEGMLHFSTSRGFLRVEFWRFVGFQFLHSHDTLAHLIFNMIGLYFFGPIVEQYLGSKRYVAFYLLCGIFGALMYVLLNLGGYAASQMGATGNIPALLFTDMSTPLIGASAGVFGVLMAGAYRAPNTTVLLMFIIPMKLRTVAYVLVGLAAFTVIRGGHNAGGEAGHLGGALAGFYFIRHPHHLHGFFDVLGRIDPTSHHYRRGGEGAGAGRRPRAIEPRSQARGPSRDEVDAVLDKVREQGLASLSEREKRILREASER